jgi:hypothetical protein
MQFVTSKLKDKLLGPGAAPGSADAPEITVAIQANNKDAVTYLNLSLKSRTINCLSFSLI